MLRHLLTQTALVIPETATGETDPYSAEASPAWDESNGREFKCRLEPFSDREVEVDRDTRVDYMKLFLPGEAAGFVTPTSKVIVDGLLYEVFGMPNEYRRRSTRVNHVECRVRRIEG